MIKTYGYTDNIQLSPHFNAHEFRCKCGKTHDFQIDDDLITKLEALYSNVLCNLFGTNLDEVKEFWVNVWTSIKNFFVGIWNGIKSFITGVVNVIKNFFTTIWTGIKNFFVGIWTAIYNSVAEKPC